jgi:hypothetical protein
MISPNLTLVLSLLFGAAVANLLIPAAELAPVQELQKRNPYYGGYALSQGATTCPASTQTCDKGFCCPKNTWCSENINGPYCCPTCSFPFLSYSDKLGTTLHSLSVREDKLT